MGRLRLGPAEGVHVCILVGGGGGGKDFCGSDCSGQAIAYARETRDTGHETRDTRLGTPAQLVACCSLQIARRAAPTHRPTIAHYLLLSASRPLDLASAANGLAIR